MNWPQIDYTGGPMYGVPDAEAHLEAARELSLSFLHWLQTECGLPGLRLRGDVLGTDGLAKAPYVRESRRIRARHTIVEHELGRHHPDSVGIGSYRIDLHPSTGAPLHRRRLPPYELPLGALIPVRVTSLLPGAKNIGTTHITNGTYRVHPVEWNVGEVAGHLAAFCTARRTTPAAVYERPDDFRAELVAAGVELRWSELIRRSCPAHSGSRSANFCTLPVEVFGSSPNSIASGALKRAIRSRQNAMSSSSVSLAPGRSVTNAFGALAPALVRVATTAASSTAGCAAERLLDLDRGDVLARPR